MLAHTPKAVQAEMQTFSTMARLLLVSVPAATPATASLRRAEGEQAREARSQAAQLRWLKRLAIKRWRPVANELLKRGKGAQPMSRAELYLHFKRNGNTAVFWSLYPG